ncbi:MAG: phosphatidate cytidylyltransferase [bacterium]|nr:phosphatidate cytidylyltransferase [bacterium]
MSKGKSPRKLLVRTVTGLTMLTAFLVFTWVPGLRPGFAFLIGLLVAVGLYEYYAIVRAREISPETIGGIIGGTLITLSGYLQSVTLVNFMLFGGCLLVSALHIVRGRHSVAGLGTTAFGVFYLGWFGAHVLLLHGLYDGGRHIGAGLVMVLFTAVVLTDTAAYFFGSAFGRHKMAPKASPNKSWEGAVAGFLCALLGVAVLYALDSKGIMPGMPGWSLMKYLHVGAMLSIIGQIGDLAESCLKRSAGVKDSGMIFPGHGGVLDRCDGFLFATPVLYYMAVPW